MEWIRGFALIVFILFSAYTIYCVRRENFWASLKSVMAMKWGRQVTADLFVGLFLFGFVIYLVEANLWTTLAWLIPMLVIGNPVSLMYFILNFDKIVAHFQGL